MRRLEVEVVAWAIEVRGEEEDRIEAVLLAVRLRADEDGLLRDAVGCVRLLRVAVPEVVLGEGDAANFGYAHTVPTITSFGLVDPRLLEDVRAHCEVREPVAPGFARFAPMPPTSAARWKTSSASASSNSCAVSTMDVRS